MTLEPKNYFALSTTSGFPIYRQIIDQVKMHIVAGRVNEGDFLPSVRAVAKDLEVNPMTVSKAYSLLEKEGVLEAVRGQGMQVAKTKIPESDLSKKEAEMAPIIKEVISKAKQVSLDENHLIRLLKNLWKE
jgi:GntR family transcriptional regulator